MSLVPPDPELNPIESALGRLAPARSRLDRDRLMFQAGVNSVRSAVSASLGLAGDRGLAGGRALCPSRSPWRSGPGQTCSLSSNRLTVAEDRPSDPSRSRFWFRLLPHSPRSKNPGCLAAARRSGLRRQVLRFGLEGLPDLPSLLSQADGAAPAPGAGSETPGLLRRYELNKVLDLGGPS